MSGRAIIIGIALSLTPSTTLFAIMLWRVKPRRAGRRGDLETRR
jgi:hypothetical protein